MLIRRYVSVYLVLLLISIPLLAQTTATSADIPARIRSEGTERSQIMKMIHMLTDIYGPRLTGSPNHYQAAAWTIKQMQEWGMENGRLEPWNFGHPGWANERLSAHIVSPVKDSLVCEVLAWTPGTDGTVIAQGYHLIIPERPTKEELEAFFTQEKAKVRGNIVLVGRHQIIPVDLDPPPKRLDDKVLQQRLDPEARPSPRPSPMATPRPGQVPPQQLSEQIDKFLKDNGALVRVNDAGRAHGQIRAFNNRTFDVSKVVPTVIMRNEDYGRISRILGNGAEVVLEFNIVNRIYPEGKTSYNATAEIRGGDKADEVIMLGGHLDSWHAATGATDNAVGCAIMMEAARIITTLGVTPRRTIRVALWSGEEQGLLGSQAYVREHFGTFENPKPDYEKFGGYLNIDSGTGRLRGATVFGPPETAAILQEILTTFKEDGVAGAVATRSRNLGGTDSTSFNQAGLPGINFVQDPIEYRSYTWHTNLDTYERILEEDVKKAAVVVASVVFELAMRDELLPRFTKETMPPSPPRGRPERREQSQTIRMER